MGRLMGMAAVGVAGLVGAAAVGQVPYPCLPDADGDGFPIFGNPQVRPDFETWQGQDYVAKATSVAFGDIDGDGWKDAVCTLAKQNYATNGIAYISVLKGHGDGVFDPAAFPIKAGVEPCHVALCDLDFDFDVDVVVADATGNAVVVLLNNGDGTLAAPVSYPVGNQPRSLIVADFDGDLMPDVVALNVLSSSVSLLRGKGDGTFDPHELTFVGNVTPRGDKLNFPIPGPFMAAGDVDGDDDLDLALPCKTEVRILLNDGFGGFTFAPAHPKIADTRGQAYGIELADLNNDKKLDAAVAALMGAPPPDFKALSVMLGNGDGTFEPAVGYDVRTEPIGGAYHWNLNVSAGDIDGDGYLDLAVSHENRSKVALVYNKGDGTFGEAKILPVFERPWFVRFEHLNPDDRIDLAVLTREIRAKLCVSLNDGVGGLWTREDTPPVTQASPHPSPWARPEWIETGDVDLDGDIDVVTANAGTGLPDDGAVNILFNDGSGKFPTNEWYPIVKDGLGWPTCVRLAHLNDDPWLDLVVTDVVEGGGWKTSGRVWVLMATGQGKYALPVDYVLDGLLPMMADVGDLDGDGDVDVVVWTQEVYPGNDITPVDRRVVIMKNDGFGSLSIDQQLVVSTVPWPFRAGSALLLDLDEDKDLDIAATAGTREQPGHVGMWINDGTGAFTPSAGIDTDPRPESLASGDFDGSGNVSVAVLHNHNFKSELVGVEAGFTILHGNGFGGIAGQTKHILDGHLLLGQLGFQYPDDPASTRLVLPEVSGRIIDIDGADVPGGGIGSHGAGAGPFGAVGARIGPEGAHAVLTANNGDDTISVLRNVGCASQPCLADCDGSGSLDLFDFLCFVNAYNNGEPAADCDGDGGLTLFDFLCFVNAFNAGCP